MASQITDNSNFCSTACWGYWLFVRGWRWISIIKGEQYGQPSQVMPSSRWSYLSSYPGYFREPHWFSMWPPGISRVTLTGIDDNVAPYTIILPTDNILNYFEETLELLSFSSQIRWRHQMETFFHVTGSSWGESTGHQYILLTMPVTRSFDVFIDLRLDKQWSKQSKRRWFETPWRS